MNLVQNHHQAAATMDFHKMATVRPFPESLYDKYI